MPQFLTEASKRSFAFAWRRALAAGRSEMSTADLLLGLLLEPECRAAMVLGECGVDAAAVETQWPEPETVSSLPQSEDDAPPAFDEIPLSVDLELSIQTARQKTDDYPQPLYLATEHLLLGVAAADHAAAAWLRERGLDVDDLETRIRRLDGQQHETTPLEMPDDEVLDLEEACVAADVSSNAEPGAGAAPGAAWQASGAAKDSPSSAEQNEIGLLRVIDAEANRAREGLRVVEDFARFVLDDRHLTEQFKRLRHALTEALRDVPIGRRLAARETQTDVGTELSTPAEETRADLVDVLTANLTRLQESLRSLEEYGKLAQLGFAAALKQMRYEAYTLQRAVEITRASCERLQDARLYVLIDGQDTAEQFETLVESLVGAGVDVLQLRDKRLDDRALLERARTLRDWTVGRGVLFIMNDRPDLAVLAEADGVHVGQEELAVKDVRTIVGPERLIGVSTHSIEQARQAVLDGANYIGVGPTFPSGTKDFENFLGVELLRAVAAEIRLPAFAIGGIGLENMQQVLAAGLDRAAVAGAVTGSHDPPAAAQALRAMLPD